MFPALVHKYPFVRLLVPFALGIGCGDYWFGEKLPIFWIALIGLLCLVSMLGTYVVKSYSRRWIFGLLAVLFFFLMGWAWGGCRLDRTAYDFPQYPCAYRIRLTDYPVQKEHTVMCRAKVYFGNDSLHRFSVDKNALVYLQDDSMVSSLKVGDELMAYCRLELPHHNGNPDEFDYARYLLHKDVSGIGFVPCGQWQRCDDGHHASSFQDQALICRNKLLIGYRQLGFSGDEFAILSALTVGYKDELSADMRQRFSVAGVNHVLALSGFHIALLSALLAFVFKRLFYRWKNGRLFSAFFTVLFLWGFGFLTGLSVSVIRSVLMFSFLTVAFIFGRRSITLNTVAATAFFMLIYSPLWLFDVGFQLSFSAVIAIVLFQPSLSGMLNCIRLKNKYINGLLSTSLAAQLGTFPLVLFYFSQFSTHFLLSNLLVIPLVTFIVYLAVLMLLVSPFHLVSLMVASLLKECIRFLESIVSWIETLPCASINRIWVNGIEVMWIYLLMSILFFFFCFRKGKILIFFLVSCLFLMGYHSYVNYSNKIGSSILFYTIKNSSVVHCICNDRHSYIVSLEDSVNNAERIEKVVGRYWIRVGLKKPQFVSSNFKGKYVTVDHGLIQFSKYRVAMIGDKSWKNLKVDSPLFIDYLYLCKGYNGTLEQLLTLFRPRCVIVDRSFPNYLQSEVIRTCQGHSLPFRLLAKEGSVSFLL